MIIRSLLTAALLVAFLMQVSSPARGEILGNGGPVSTVWCETEIGFTLLVAQMRVALPDPPPGCYLSRPVFPTPQMMAQATLVAGPYADFEGDTFAVFEITRSDDSRFYPFVWWRFGFSPIGMKA